MRPKYVCRFSRNVYIQQAVSWRKNNVLETSAQTKAGGKSRANFCPAPIILFSPVKKARRENTPKGRNPNPTYYYEESDYTLGARGGRRTSVRRKADERQAEGARASEPVSRHPDTNTPTFSAQVRGLGAALGGRLHDNSRMRAPPTRK